MWRNRDAQREKKRKKERQRDRERGVMRDRARSRFYSPILLKIFLNTRKLTLIFFPNFLVDTRRGVPNMPRRRRQKQDAKGPQLRGTFESIAVREERDDVASGFENADSHFNDDGAGGDGDENEDDDEDEGVFGRGIRRKSPP